MQDSANDNGKSVKSTEKGTVCLQHYSILCITCEKLLFDITYHFNQICIYYTSVCVACYCSFLEVQQLLLPLFWLHGLFRPTALQDFSYARDYHFDRICHFLSCDAHSAKH